VAGILGGLFAVPIAGVLWVLVSAVYHHFVIAEPENEVASGSALAEAAIGPPLTDAR
jgi:predicted PurR-regulated permease PerM